MEVVLDRDYANDWAYRGEGAVNLVLAYTGSSPAFIGKVMRIHKTPTNGNGKSSEAGVMALTGHELLLWGEIGEALSSENMEVVEHLYVKLVMSPLLGPKHVDAGIRVFVSRDFLECVDKNVIPQRPSCRVDAAKVDMDRTSVLLMDDHAIFKPGFAEGEACLSVEIKPKCGFLPCSRFINKDNIIKESKTRFEMHQVLKLQEREISELSEYNPLDLFSGSRGRIHKAIKALYATPQNNFRVFLNGSLVFGGLGGVTGSTTIKTEEAFEDVLEDVIRAHSGQRANSFIQLVAEMLYKSGVLDQLLEIQKLDRFDIEGVIHAYYNIISQSCMVCRELDGEEVSTKYSSFHSISLDESLRIVRDYLIAATAKDCSLIISFRQGGPGGTSSSYNSLHLESTNQTFDYKVHFIDLDLKPLRKIEDYYELDKKIVTSYMQILKTMHGQNEDTDVIACKDVY